MTNKTIFDLAATAGLTNSHLLEVESSVSEKATLQQVVTYLLAHADTTEKVQDIVGALVAAAGGTYNDAAGTITLPSNSTQGKHDVPIEAGAMHPRTVNGCSSLAWLDVGAGKPEVGYLAFDATTQQFAVFALKMPKSWNEATITFSVDWMHPTTSTNFGVVFGLSAASFGDTDSLNVNLGTAQTVSDTGGTADMQYTTHESSAITIANTPATRDAVYLQLSRNPADGSDTLAVAARVLRVTVYITTDADTDA